MKTHVRAFFTDKHGNIILGQTPNIPILLWLGFTAATLLLPEGNLANLAGWLARLSLVIWAVAELGWGVNGFRRTLGLLVLSWSLYSIFW